MIRLREDIWTRLGAEPVQGEYLRARLAVPEISNALIAALGEDLERHFLIPVPTTHAEIQDAQSRGVQVSTRDLSIPGKSAGRYLDIVCRDAGGHDVFDLIGGELAERLNGIETPAEVVQRVLSKWRRFWGHGAPVLLSKERQIGLLSELWFLSKWLLPSLSLRDGVSRWRGPFGARHDFEWVGASVEVKATLSSRGPIHKIHGLDQLNPPDSGVLFFFSLMLREERGGAHSLSSTVDFCYELLAQDAQALDDFERALASAGFSMAFRDEYSELRLRIVGQGLYRVTDHFPRLRRQGSSVAGDLASIEHIDYDINLGGHESLRIATEPGGLKFL